MEFHCIAFIHFTHWVHNLNLKLNLKIHGNISGFEHGGGKNRLGKEFAPADAQLEKLVLELVLVLVQVPSGRSGKERTAGVAGSSASSPQVSGNGIKDLFIFLDSDSVLCFTETSRWLGISGLLSLGTQG